MTYNDLVTVANKHHVVSTKEFSQFFYISRFPKSSVEDGMCRALSAAFVYQNYVAAVNKLEDPGKIDPNLITTNKREGFFKQFVSAFGAPSTGEADRFHQHANLQRKYRQEGRLTEGDLINAAKQTLEELSDNHLQGEQHQTVCYYGRGVTETALPDRHGYYLISTGQHMMAVVCRDSLQGPRIKFFDPNAGQAIFDNVDNARSFLTEYFSEGNYDPAFFIPFKG